MEQIFNDVFTKYTAAQAPFLHQQFTEWHQTKPLRGLRILHHIPLFQNTLMKIACLITAGAEVVVTNPEWLLEANPEAVAALRKEKIEFVANVASLKDREFDIYLDCGAELYQRLGNPRLGAVEITGSGDQYYRRAKLNVWRHNTDICLCMQSRIKLYNYHEYSFNIMMAGWIIIVV